MKFEMFGSGLFSAFGCHLALQICLAVLLLLSPQVKSVQAEEIVIESVLASVDGVPITLQEFSDRLEPKRQLSPADFASDATLGQRLDAMIMERLIEAEANSRRIKASPEDIERYIAQVATQNNLSRSEFESALSEQGKSLQEFERQAKLEILRSRLMGQLAQSAPAVIDSEIEETVEDEDREEALSSAQRLRFRLREIVLANAEGQDEDLQDRASQIISKLEAGESFTILAKQYSNGPTAQDGGDLGEVAADDLSELVRESVEELSPQEFTEPLVMEESTRIFFLEKRLEEGESSELGQKEDLRKEMENQKLERRLQEFFTVELPRLHKVEKKV